ncbi:hypothetical protein [Pseudoalteromonas luteoviolacea]|uniref:hypothetical protein n=1 Tax=Pseudoalteromonas luteoviolacea TaxID=43657 RepID=UPI000A535EB5|nr:hypothetical protein [Pseudoalteromonas luteoviolacea]
MLYQHTDVLLVELSNNGMPIELCSNKRGFVLSADMPAGRRDRMCSMLLATLASAKGVVISYTNTGVCLLRINSQCIWQKLLG